jgi:hypothetical protein
MSFGRLALKHLLSRRFRFLLAPAVLVLTWSACATQDFYAKVDDPGAIGQSVPVDVVRATCRSGTPSEKTVQVHFADPKNLADPKQTCQFDKNGNLAHREAHFQARVEQSVEFDLPSGSTICSMEFSFPTQQFVFDDYFFLTFDGSVLAASHPVQSILPRKSEIMQYSWKEMSGKKWPAGVDTVVYCLGKESNQASCEWPNTERVGQIRMRFDPDILQRVTALNSGRTRHQFKFITTGDNDPEIDCQHSPVSFQVKVRYVK